MLVIKQLLTFSGSWYGPSAPVTAADLRAMSVNDVLQYLRTWQPLEGPQGASPEGLGRELASLVAEEPGRFAAHAEAFSSLEPTYVRALITGLSTAVRQKVAISWMPVLQLCTWILQQAIGPRENPLNFGRDSGWTPTRQEIASLLSAGFEAPIDSGIPLELRRLSWDVLNLLTRDPDPTPEDDQQFGPPNMSPATLSINTVRGEAIHAVVRYVQWLRRQMEREQEIKPNDQEPAAHGYAPEAFAVLDIHLDPIEEPSPAIRAVYGQWFPYLLVLDESWTTEHISAIFSRSNDLGDIAWQTYVTFNPPYDKVFATLQDEYSRAVDDLSVMSLTTGDGVDPHQRLAEHLIILYWRGRLTMEWPVRLLERFFMNASVALRAHAIEFVGRALGNQEATAQPEVRDRLRRLWDARLESVRQAVGVAMSMHKDGPVQEVIPFGWWFGSIALDSDGRWAVQQLEAVLRLTGGTVEPVHRVLERLPAVAAIMPKSATECLEMLLRPSEQVWSIQAGHEYIRPTLEAAINSADPAARKQAVDIVNLLGRQGDISYRDLLSTHGALA